MSNVQFTPGPWVAVDDRYIDGAAITCESRKGMVEIAKLDSAYVEDSYPENMGGFEREQLANAHLIAAAPEMYEALEQCINLISQGKVYEFAGKPAELEEWIAVLTKARGES